MHRKLIAAFTTSCTGQELCNSKHLMKVEKLTKISLQIASKQTWNGSAKKHSTHHQIKLSYNFIKMPALRLLIESPAAVERQRNQINFLDVSSWKILPTRLSDWKENFHSVWMAKNRSETPETIQKWIVLHVCDYLCHYQKQFTQLYKIAVALPCCPILPFSFSLCSQDL